MHCFAYKRCCPVLYFPCKIRYTEDHIGRIFIFCRLWQFQYGGTVYVSFMGKIWKDNRMLQDTVVCDDSDDTRTHKIFTDLRKSAIKWIWKSYLAGCHGAGFQKA